MKLFQQGDVLFHQSKIPTKKLSRLTTPVIQEGEHTGHAHRLRFRHGDEYYGGSAPKVDEAVWELFVDPETKEKYLRVLGDKPAEVSHEEHKTIAIPPGEYRIGIVQEYDHFAEEARAVQD
jgi:hypothetical protein